MTRRLVSWSGATAIGWLLIHSPLVAQDAERAAHTDSAATPQVSFEAKGDGWTLRQYQLGCLSHLSYLLAANGVAAVVDPQRDVEHYVRDAAALGARIHYVLLTHPHADFVAGHTELAQIAAAEIAISELANAAFPHRALRDGDRIALGGVSIEAWATPGHTPNAMTFLVRVPDGSADPAFALTGDTLFVGSIGRPDLLDVPPAQLASQSFTSIQRLKTLPEATVVLPAHGAGSLCGAHLSPDTSSTIGREKATNPYLRIASEATFVANVISHQPVAPRYFAFNVEMNRKGPPLVERTTTLPAVADAAAARSLLDAGAWIVDVRDQRAYAAAHVLGAINVALRGRLDTWTGIVVPFTQPLILVGADDEIREGIFRLRRIGYDRVAARLPDDPAAWRAAGLEVRSSKVIAPADLAAVMAKGEEPLIVDVRSADEYADLRLGDVGNIPVTESDRFATTLAKDRPVVMVCNSAYRSSMAVGLAERLGFVDVASLDGGLDAWVAAGLPTIGRMAKAMATPETLALPEPIDATMLSKVLSEQPAVYAVVDLRPAAQFAEWSIPGSKNVAVDAIAAHVDSLGATMRIVLVDRDGSFAFAVGGALMAKRPDRVLRVLHGGLQRFHRDVVLGGVLPMSRAAPPNASPPTTPAAPAAQPKKRSAGC